VSFADPGTVAGTGTANSICKWITGATIGNALITDDGIVVTANTRSTFYSDVASSGTHSFCNIVGTLPSVTSGVPAGFTVSIVSAGNTHIAQFAARSLLFAGYTGASGTAAFYAYNEAIGGGAGNINGDQSANVALFGDYVATNAALGVGTFGRAFNGTGKRIGAVGLANSATGGSLNIGGYFLGRGGTTYVGLFAGLASDGAGDPTFTSTGLLVDNADAAVPIAIFRDNGTAKVTIQDGGATLFAAGVQQPIVTKAIDYTVTTDDYSILVDASAANRTITLPAASSCAGLELNVKKIDSTAHTVTIGGGGSNIDGAATLVISVQYNSYYLQSDGTQWWVL